MHATSFHDYDDAPAFQGHAVLRSASGNITVDAGVRFVNGFTCCGCLRVWLELKSVPLQLLGSPCPWPIDHARHKSHDQWKFPGRVAEKWGCGHASLEMNKRSLLVDVNPVDVLDQACESAGFELALGLYGVSVCIAKNSLAPCP